MGLLEAVGRDLIRYKAHRSNNYALINTGALLMYAIVGVILAYSVFHYSNQSWVLLTFGDYEPATENTAVTATYGNTFFDGTNSQGMWHSIYNGIYLKNVSDCLEKTNMDYYCSNNQVIDVVIDFWVDSLRPSTYSFSGGYTLNDPNLVSQYTNYVFLWQQNFTVPNFCNMTDLIETQCAANGGGTKVTTSGFVPCANRNFEAVPERSNTLIYWFVYCNDGAVNFYFPTADQVGCIDFAEALARSGLEESAPEICATWAFDNATTGKYQTHFIQSHEQSLDTLSIASLSAAAGYTAVTGLSLILFALNTTFPRFREKDSGPQNKRSYKVLGIDFADSNLVTPVQCISYIPHGKQHRRFVFFGVGIVVCGLLAGYATGLYLFASKTTQELNLGTYDPKAVSNVATQFTDGQLVIGGTAFNFTYRMIWTSVFIPTPEYCYNNVFDPNVTNCELTFSSGLGYISLLSNISTGRTSKTILYYNDPSLDNSLCREALQLICNSTTGFVDLLFGPDYFNALGAYYCLDSNRNLLFTVAKNPVMDEALTKCAYKMESQYPNDQFCHQWAYDHSADSGAIFVRTYETHLTNLEIFSYAMQPVITAASVSMFILGCLNYQRHIARDVRKSRRLLSSASLPTSSTLSSIPSQSNVNTTLVECCQLNGESFYTPTRAMVYEASPQNNYLFLNISRLALFVIAALLFALAASYFSNIPTTTTSLGPYDVNAESNTALSPITSIPNITQGYNLALRTSHIRNLEDCRNWTSYDYLCSQENTLNLYAIDSKIVFEISNALKHVYMRYVPTREELSPACLQWNDTLWASGPNTFCVPPTWAPAAPGYVVESRTCKGTITTPTYYCGYGIGYYSTPASSITNINATLLHQLGQTCATDVQQIVAATDNPLPGCEAAVFAPTDRGNFYTRTYTSYPGGITVILLCLSIMNPLLVIGHILIDVIHTRFFAYNTTLAPVQLKNLTSPSAGSPSSSPTMNFTALPTSATVGMMPQDDKDDKLEDNPQTPESQTEALPAGSSTLKSIPSEESSREHSSIDKRDEEIPLEPIDMKTPRHSNAPKQYPDDSPQGSPDTPNEEGTDMDKSKDDGEIENCRIA